MRAGDVVTLRVRTASGPTEVVGTLVAASPTQMSVRRRDGSVVVVEVDQVEAGRVVPPGPARTIDAVALQQVMALGWRAAEVEQLGGWLLRANGGFTGRANSALVTDEAVEDVAGRLAAVRSWYADRGLGAILQAVSGREPAGLVDELERQGWERSAPTHAMTAELAPVLRGIATADVDVRLDGRPDDAWLSRYREDEGPLPENGVELLTRHPSAVFASVREHDAPVAIARVVVDERWAGIFAVEVDLAHRRRGLGTAVVIAALQWAVRNGARRAYLQVRSVNAAGVAMWSRLGFAVHHDYVYWTAPT